MLKIILCFVFIVSSTLLGNWFSEKLTRRKKTLELLISSFSKMKTLISFGGYEVYRVVRDSFAEFPELGGITEFSEACDSFPDSWNICVDSLPERYGLNTEDKKVLKKFAEGLGVSDTDGQVSNCELYCGLLREQLQEAKEREKSSGRLYRVLGFSLGCVVTLMIV